MTHKRTSAVKSGIDTFLTDITIVVDLTMYFVDHVINHDLVVRAGMINPGIMFNYQIPYVTIDFDVSHRSIP